MSSEELEPRFRLPETTPRSSKRVIILSGIRFFMYGFDEAVRAAGAMRDAPAVPEIAVMYLAHNRTRTHVVTQNIAHEILWRYREGVVGFDGETAAPGRLPLIAVTMDMRNHGEREINADANRTWKGGNEDHAVDLVSIIDGCAQDLHLAMTYLPCCLSGVRIARNFVFGVSLGAHCAWRLPRVCRGPGSPAIDGMALVVGCPDLAGLLLSRLGAELDKLTGGNVRAGQISYADLKAGTSEQQQRRWPEALHRIVAAGDDEVRTAFPLAGSAGRDGIRLLLFNGALDPLVPPRYTRDWVEAHGGESGGAIEFHVQDRTAHSCTKEMVARTADWLRELVA